MQPTFKPSAMTINSGANRVAVLKAGSGPAVVIVHGIGGHKEDWLPTMAALAPHHTVYAIDMVGFGGSSKDAAEITVATQVAAVSALLDAEKIDKASLVGNSVGGWVAASFAAAHPGRVSRLVLSNAAGFKAMFEGPSPVNFYPSQAAEMQKLLSYVRFAPEARTDQAVASALAALEASGDKVAGEKVFKGLFVSPRLEDVLQRVQAPTLVVWGEQDRLFPAPIADLVVGNLRGARKVLIPSAGHFPQLDNPAVFNTVVAEFLR